MSRNLPFSLVSALTLVSLTAALPLYARPQGQRTKPPRSEAKSTSGAPLFVDVPGENINYARMQDLQRRGILPGNLAGYFSGKPLRTRYEFAIVIERLINSMKTLTLAQDGKTLQPASGIPNPPAIELGQHDTASRSAVGASAPIPEVAQAQEILALCIEFQLELGQIGCNPDTSLHVRKTLETYVAASTPAHIVSGKVAQLFRACEKGNLKSVQELVSEGVDVNARNEDGKTPLMAAANYEDGTVANKNVTSLAMVKFLLTKGAKINLLDDFHTTALMYAAIKANDDVTKLLLNRGAIAHVTLLDPATLVLSETESEPEIICEYRLHLGEIFSKVNFTCGQKKGLAAYNAWTRSTDEHYRNIFDLLKSKARPSGP